MHRLLDHLHGQVLHTQGIVYPPDQGSTAPPELLDTAATINHLHIMGTTDEVDDLTYFLMMPNRIDTGWLMVRNVKRHE